MSATPILTPMQAERIKAAIWHGEPEAYIADNFSISKGLVHHMVHGIRYSETPWPDGSFGKIKGTRLKHIARARSKARRECLPQITRTMNARVRAILETEP